jgi:hypothetical protein
MSHLDLVSHSSMMGSCDRDAARRDYLLRAQGRLGVPEAAPLGVCLGVKVVMSMNHRDLPGARA